MILNWVDWVIIAVGSYYIFKGWEQGLLKLGTSLLSFLISLWLAIKYHVIVGTFLVTKFGLPSLWGTVLGYVVVGFGSEAAVRQLLIMFIARLPQRLVKLKMNNFLGAMLSLANGAVIMAFILLVILVLPLKGSAKADIRSSRLASKLVTLTEKYGGEFRSSLNQVSKQFLTIDPESEESINISLDRATLNLTVDEQAEGQMLQQVNSERAKIGLKPLKLDTKIRAVARAHSKDMYSRNYFSHLDPDGHDAGYRLDKAGVNYSVAGENLAFAPDVNTAHNGLMNSEGHRKNILEPRFTRIGIGVIAGGAGNEMMFTQDFAD